jgi:hypothetical protein
MNKKTFYLNFCRKHQHRDAYVRIVASSYDSAYLNVVAKYNMDWQQITEEEKFDKAKFPKGELMVMEVG